MNRQVRKQLLTGATIVLVIVMLELLGRFVSEAWARVDVYPDHVHTYQIAGRITTSDGAALAGVTVKDNQGHNTVTDGQGNYLVSGLDPGEYVVWAEKAGYGFTPSTRRVTLPPSASNQDFAARVKRPVIIVPGTGGSANWDCFLFELYCDWPVKWGWTPSADTYYASLVNHLRAAGYTEENQYLHYFFYDWRRPPAENAARLKAKIDEVRAATTLPTVDLVAHSQGGLVSRAYIQGGSFENDVAHLITLGTPHQGIPMLYPYWEAGFFYNIGWVERLGFDILTRRWATLGLLPSVTTTKLIMPSIKDMLPTFDYLYDEQHGDRVKPEVQMKQRNTYLPALNADVSKLFARTDVSTFAGNNVATPLRYYTHGWVWWQPDTWWPNWEDGVPNWNREPQFKLMTGDNTVPVFSAKLTGAHIQEFNNVKHGDLPNTPAVVHAVLTTLGIPLPADLAVALSAAAEQPLLVMMVEGPAQATVTDPLGRTVGPASASIPNAQYVSEGHSPYKLILIPAPVEGHYAVTVTGNGPGAYALSLLDTFTEPATVIENPLSRWDSPQSQIVSGGNVVFGLDYAGAATSANLMAQTPMLTAPAWAGTRTVDGRAGPGQAFEIRASSNGVLLGSGVVGADGRFKTTLATTLQWKQRIHVYSNGWVSLSVTVDRRATLLPAVRKN
jgi:pimeloyl-ACP methyl ester carboxylesterase